jgi:hypothetical protein
VLAAVRVSVAAVFAEPVQEEGGVREIPADTLRALRALADRSWRISMTPVGIDPVRKGRLMVQRALRRSGRPVVTGWLQG